MRVRAVVSVAGLGTRRSSDLSRSFPLEAPARLKDNTGLIAREGDSEFEGRSALRTGALRRVGGREVELRSHKADPGGWMAGGLHRPDAGHILPVGPPLNEAALLGHEITGAHDAAMEQNPAPARGRYQHASRSAREGPFWCRSSSSPGSGSSFATRTLTEDRR